MTKKSEDEDVVTIRMPRAMAHNLFMFAQSGGAAELHKFAPAQFEQRSLVDAEICEVLKALSSQLQQAE